MFVEDKDYILKIVEKYQKKYRQENVLPEFQKLLAQNSSPISRKNFFGHITASAIVLDQSLKKIALIHHHILDLWLQPGGHVDQSDETFRMTADREFVEETGLSGLVKIDFDDYDLPLHIDIHEIPENKNKQELKHRHFDLMYLFLLNQNQKVKINQTEIRDFQWCKLEDVKFFSPSLSRVVDKIFLIFAENSQHLSKLTEKLDKND